MPKTRIVELLGEKALLLPALMSAAVTANDQAKYVLGLLQLAAANAESPKCQAANFAHRA
jgi:hypothetical protein